MTIGKLKGGNDLIPNDPEYELLLKMAYDTDSDEERKAAIEIMKEDRINKEIYEGILISKEEMGFNTIEEHLAWGEVDKRKTRKFFEDYKTKKKVDNVIKR